MVNGNATIEGGWLECVRPAGVAPYVRIVAVFSIPFALLFAVTQPRGTQAASIGGVIIDLGETFNRAYF